MARSSMNPHLLFHAFFSFSTNLPICKVKASTSFQKQTLAMSWVSHNANRCAVNPSRPKVILRTLGLELYVYTTLSFSKINKTFGLWFTSYKHVQHQGGREYLLSVLFVPQRKATEKVKRESKRNISNKVLFTHFSETFNCLTALIFKSVAFPRLLLNVSITSFMLLLCPALN